MKLWLTDMSDFFILIYHWITLPQVWSWLVMLMSVLLGIVSALITWNVLQRREARRRKAQGSVKKTEAWHSISGEQALNKLRASVQGLVEAEIIARQQRYGLNRLPEIKPRSAFLRFISQFHNLLIYVGQTTTQRQGTVADAFVNLAYCFCFSDTGQRYFRLVPVGTHAWRNHTACPYCRG